MKVTVNERVHDSKALSELVDGVIKSNTIAGKLFADGTYDGNDIFKFLIDSEILHCIKVRKKSNIKLKTRHILRTYQL